MNTLSARVALLVSVLAISPWAHAGEDSRPIPRAVPSFREILRRPLSLTEALDIAAEQNALILAARKDVEARFGVAVQVRSIVLPKVIAEAAYGFRQDSLIEQNQNREVPEVSASLPLLGIETTLGGGNTARINNQTWSADVRIVQSIYEGGRMMSALRQDQLIREQAMLDFQTVVADVLLGVRVAYDDAQLAALQIQLREQSVGLLGGILGQIQEQRKVGAVTEFEELRAKVEQDNARTPLAIARQDRVISEQRLIQLMGYDEPAAASNNLPLNLSTSMRAPKYESGLEVAILTAGRQRSELAAIQVGKRLGDEAIVVARSGYKPSVQGFVGHQYVSRVQSRNIGDPYHGTIAGVQMSWALFDGFLTQGRVSEATARRDQTAHLTDELARQIQLQVRSEWARLVEARNILNVQAGNIESGIRAMELANLRFSTGIGTQVEVLSAQTALTDARDFYAQALRNYSVAYSRLLRATGEDMQRTRAGER
ncbi:MAG: TolC family protein [Chthoniobacteraceae bacterium]